MDGKCRGVPGNRPLKKLFEAYGAGTYTWLAPKEMLALIRLSGGGGGGGGGAGDTSGPPFQGQGGSGGGGSYLETTIRLSPGTTYSITLGAGGTAGSAGSGSDASGGSGGTGGDSYIVDTSGNYLCFVSGGNGGPGGVGGLSPLVTSSTPGVQMGGRGGYGGAWNNPGGSVQTATNGTPANVGPGAGGINIYSNGGGVGIGGTGGGGLGTGGISGSTDALVAATVGGYGAGGGGGGGVASSTGYAGAAGGAGAIIIYELPTP